jgi:2'-5' RNA ligase
MISIDTASKEVCDANDETCKDDTTTVADVKDPYKSSSFIGISLWMCPTGKANDAYTSIIQETAKEYGTYSAFIPHITLVAALLSENVLERVRTLATQIPPYEFEVDELSSRDAYFQSVYMKLKTTPDAVKANDIAKQFFDERQRDPPYMPHMSLIYGDLTPNQKDVVLPKISEKLKDAPKTLAVDSIQVWSTQGNVEDWYVIETVPLTGPTF